MNRPQLCQGILSHRLSAIVLSVCVVVAAAANLWPSSADAATEVSGTVATDTRWDADGSPYVLTGNITVQSGRTLTIEPGVTVTSDGMFGVNVLGTLTAVGTAPDPLILSLGRGLRLYPGSEASELAWATIRDSDHGILPEPLGGQWAAWPSTHDLHFVNNADAVNFFNSTGPKTLRDTLFVNNGSAVRGGGNSGSTSLTRIGVAESQILDIAVDAGPYSISESNLLSFSSDSCVPSGWYCTLWVQLGAAADTHDVWWGTTSEPAIQSRIIDGNDEPGRGVVSFDGVASAAHDLYPPTSTPDQPENGFLGSSAGLTGVASDDGPVAVSGIAAVTASIEDRTSGQWWNGTTWTTSEVFGPAAGTSSWEIAKPALIDGHEYRVRSEAVDAAFNSQWGAGSTTFVADATTPAAFGLLGPAAGAQNRPAGQRFSWESASDATSGVDRYELWIDGVNDHDVAISACAAGTCSATALAPLVEGAHSWSVTAIDAAGNVRTSGLRGFDVDATAPAAFALDAPADGADLKDVTPTLSWQAATDAGSGLDHYEVFVDGARHGGQISSATTSHTLTSDLSEGDHNWRIDAVDGNANTRASATRALTIDTTAPDSQLTGGPERSTRADSATFDISSSDSSARFECQLDGHPWSACTSPHALMGLAAGTHEFRVRAIDSVGNVDASPAIWPWKVDHVTPPDGRLTLTPNPALTGQTVSLDASTSRDPLDGHIVNFSWDADGNGSFETDSGPAARIDRTYPASGGIDVAVRVTNATGQQAVARAHLEVRAPPLPHARLTLNPTLAITGQTVSLDASGSTDPLDGQIANFAWDIDGDGSYEWDTGGTGRTDRTYAVSGRFDVGVRVTNESGRQAVARAQVEVRPAPPVGRLGVTINHGAQYTNDSAVTVSAIWPTLAATTLLSNDGGFGNASPRALEPSVNWTLDSSGPERLPKTVYVRFEGGESGRETYQDDIILDDTPPKLLKAAILPAASGSASMAARYVRIRLKATDRTSGVRLVQLARKKRHPAKARRFRRTIRATGRPVYVRVRDRAGNASRWRKLHR